jgi:LPXTG-motif cell wall-anchored protein
MCSIRHAPTRAGENPLASRVLGAFVVAGAATLVSLALATPASAHTPKWGASCDENAKVTKVWVNLTAYKDGGRNDVVVKDANGTEVLKKNDFGKNHSESKENLDATVDHTFTITVKAWDGYNYTDTKPVGKCVTPPKPEQPKPEQPQPPKPEQPPVVTTTEAPSSSVTPPAPGGSTPEPPLAATGASPMWLLLSGLGLVGAGAGTLLFLRRRRSA